MICGRQPSKIFSSHGANESPPHHPCRLSRALRLSHKTFVRQRLFAIGSHSLHSFTAAYSLKPCQNPITLSLLNGLFRILPKRSIHRHTCVDRCCPQTVHHDRFTKHAIALKSLHRKHLRQDMLLLLADRHTFLRRKGAGWFVAWKEFAHDPPNKNVNA